MPSKTEKQAKFMAAVANSPKFAKKVDVPQSVGKDFAAADKRKEDEEDHEDEADREEEEETSFKAYYKRRNK